MKRCLVCDSAIEPFISFGRMPLADAFLTPEQFASEYFYNLEVASCGNCRMVQLSEQVDREKMFHEEYAYYSSTSNRMIEHFAGFARFVSAEVLSGRDPFVVEIGSNDGIMLRNFAAAGIRHLGVEPSANVAEVATGTGIRTICEFFDETTADDILSQDGQADAILGANVMCHIPYLHSVLEGVKLLLKPGGLLIFEDPYLGDIIEKTAFDQIYDEHTFYFSAGSVSNLVEMHGLELVGLAPQNVHGGSMRYLIAHRGTRPRSEAVAAQVAREEALGLTRPESFERFRRKTEQARDELMALLGRLKGEGRRVVGYGATAKSATVTNFCGITPELVEFVSDTTPIKQGKFTPGAHLPVRPYSEFTASYPDYALLFAWNHAAEIMEKERAFRDAGGKWIVYVPEVAVLD